MEDCWLAPNGIQSKTLPVDAVSEEHQPDLLVAQIRLRELTEWSRDQVPVPDGLVPVALQIFLTGLGCGLRHTQLTITQCLRAQLESICTLTQTRQMQVAQFWQQVGVVTLNEDAVTHSKPYTCPSCSLPSIVFFKIHKDHGTASATLIQVTLQKQQDDVNTSLHEDGQTRVKNIAACTANQHALYLCFGCAACPSQTCAHQGCRHP